MLAVVGTMAITGFGIGLGFSVLTGLKNIVMGHVKKIGEWINSKVTQSWIKYQANGKTSIGILIGGVWALLGYHMTPSKYMDMVSNYGVNKFND